MFDACPHCGYNQREGAHGLVASEDDAMAISVCQVSVDAKPIVHHVVDVTNGEAFAAMKES